MSRLYRMKVRVTVIGETEAGEFFVLRVAVPDGTDPIQRASALLVRQGHKLGHIIALIHGWPQFHYTDFKIGDKWPWHPALDLVDDQSIAIKGERHSDPKKEFKS